MLVTLGNNQAISAGAQATYPYACRSVQKIFVKVDDPNGSQSFDHTLTVQLGQRTIVQSSARGLAGFSMLAGNQEDTTNEVYYVVDLGSHQLLNSENLYVTVNASSALDAVDISALVDSPTGGEMPVRYTEYSDNTFTAENVLVSLAHKSDGSSIAEDSTNCEIRNPVSSSSPTFISAHNWFGCTTLTYGYRLSYGILVQSAIPLTTTFNYPSSATVNRIVVASQMGTNQRAISQGRQQNAIARSQVGQ